MRITKPSEVIFIDNKIEKAFEKLDNNNEIKRTIKRAIKDLQQNAYSGIQIPKRLIPKEYIKKYEIENLWKYNLPNGWRLIYSLAPQNKVEILTLVLEWFNHRNYNRRFRYN